MGAAETLRPRGRNGAGHRIIRAAWASRSRAGLAEAGAAVVLNGADAGRMARRDVRIARAPGTLFTSRFDVTNETAVSTAFDRFDAEGVAIDILFNNAGIQLRQPMVESDNCATGVA